MLFVAQTVAFYLILRVGQGVSDTFMSGVVCGGLVFILSTVTYTLTRK